MSWWAAHVSYNREYDTKREIIALKILGEDDILIPRRMIYDVVDEKLTKKTEMVLPGYILLNIGNTNKMGKMQILSNYLDLLGEVTEEEMETIRSYENIPKHNDAHDGDKIIVTRGPFAGVKGNIIKESELGRFKCRLLFHGNEIMADMDARLIEKIA